MPISSANADLVFPDFEMNSASMPKFSHGELSPVKQQVRHQRIVLSQTVARKSFFRHKVGMEIDLKSALKKRGMSQQQLADAIDVSKGYISEIANGKKQPSIETLEQILDALDANVSEIVSSRHTISIAGCVGAGAQVPVFDVYEKGDGPQVECPPGLSPHGIVAVEVVGDSMEPVYSAGDLLFYTRATHDGVPDEAIGHRCVCEDENGMGWVKQVKRGSEPGLFNLVSLNPGADNMHDVRLKWAARVRLHWPAELARKA